MTILSDLDEQSRERLIRAAEDLVRAELRRVNTLLTEAIEQRDEYRREWECALERIEALRHVPETDVIQAAFEQQCDRAAAAEREVESLRVGIAQLRARLAEESARPPAPSAGPCAHCAVPTDARVLTSDGALCVRCWTQRGAAAE